MIQDFRSQEDGQAFEADLCVIGAGAAGIAIATRFVATDIRVCLVESEGCAIWSGRSEPAEPAPVC